ncbi:Predicted RNA binding protein YcfA, dsRBD-like fold, HicA-like mRNA interferase family [Ignavigranum ruoffiae]|uniref:Predicted RNA binding protein YcfA, dsRBD-like fold, HicA-like mRNA interferase family n=1 Tax=Ignavigranum ruoffiae TaxID=89093 RepID=A0A1H9EPZ1_9LACT|nr:type II toxin-antitoxin system HicA family toxin [Ignavigranum ruoffiae]SEQ27283.1 Predicted RNA binding protein YcfA, dsRBD-like fold, HicA-like mRNA interferase family [Ignavigranum ruoffiae]
MDSKEIIKYLKEDGGYLVGSVGSHKHFNHLIKKVKVTVSPPLRDFPIKTLNSIFKQAGLK